MKIRYKIKEDYFDTTHSAGMPNRGELDYRMEEEKGESPGENPDLDGDGIYSPAELEYHFDLNQDGKVTPDEYKDHVKWHERHPEVFEVDESLLGEKKKVCWVGYKQYGMKKKGRRRVPNCVPINEAFATLDDGSPVCESCLYETILESENTLQEAEYHGHSVPLGKPMKGDVKKFKVYVRDPKTGNVKKVNFGDPNMRIKKSNPARRKSFRARHHCENPGPRTKARYWSCRKW
jgi:hypothetical protein